MIRSLLPILGLAVITVTGTVGYVLVEDLRWLDALYMTVITISTVGYKEVEPLSDSGKLFTVALIATTGGVALYLLGMLAQTILSLPLPRFLSRDDMQKLIDRLSGHVIVCGCGRFGRIVIEELRNNGVDLVVVESDPEKESLLSELGGTYVIGSAADDSILARAGVARARAILVGTGSDAENVFITLAAREANPAIRVYARGETDAAMNRLLRAGASQVISAYQAGGLRMANSILRPSVVDFLEIARARSGQEIDLEEVRLEPGCRLIGVALRSLDEEPERLRVVGVKRGDDKIQILPKRDLTFTAGDHLVVIGERERLAAVAAMACATSPEERESQ